MLKLAAAPKGRPTDAHGPVFAQQEDIFLKYIFLDIFFWLPGPARPGPNKTNYRAQGLDLDNDWHN
jgi:hypothetical protein